MYLATEFLVFVLNLSPAFELNSSVARVPTARATNYTQFVCIRKRDECYGWCMTRTRLHPLRAAAPLAHLFVCFGGPPNNKWFLNAIQLSLVWLLPLWFGSCHLFSLWAFLSDFVYCFVAMCSVHIYFCVLMHLFLFGLLYRWWAAAPLTKQ